ncbi:KilA-N domain-containing protein [Paracoccus angustae]|uniref:KilA-N domain-containing protein n=1 Tax=Paracoccus angustae TaxID=1671480 RepID=A0ABV7TZS4_9RHOB
MTLIEPSGKGLVYQGTLIRDKGEMLSLTDMWKAAGSPESQKPSEWLRQDATKAFVECVTGTLEVGQDHIQTKRGGRGVGGSTFAHWQIGLAYAKYLSPEFHMWCNSVVRAHMEGEKLPGIPAETLEQIERSFGIMRMVVHKVTEIEKALPGIVQHLVEPLVAARLAESAYLLRSGKTAKQIWDAHGLPPRIKGSALWFGNRLAEGGCLLEGRADRGEKAIRLYDPDKAETILGLGLLHKTKVYASERMGQGRFKLVEGRA